jgi:hypothetical protein
MPFKIVKQKDKYRLYNLDKKQYTKNSFNTRQAAENMKRAYMMWDSHIKSDKKKYSK